MILIGSFHKYFGRSAISATGCALGALLVTIEGQARPNDIGLCDRNRAVVEAIEREFQKPCSELTSSDLEILNVLSVENDGTQLTPSDFRGLENMESLGINNPGPLQPGLFVEMPMLALLNLDQIDALPAGFFDGMAHLFYFSVYNETHVPLLPILSEVANSSVRHLSLYMPWANELSSGDIPRLQSIKSLLIGAGKMTVHAGALSNLPNLETVQFDADQMSFDDDSLASPSLAFVNLRLREDFEMTQNALGSCSKLRSLDIETTSFNLPFNPFLGRCTELRRISIASKAPFKGFQAGYFSRLSKLNELNLGPVTRLLPLGSDLKSLQILRAREVEKIDPAALAELTGLRELSLGLSAKHIPTGAFDGLSHLRKLEISSDNLEVIDQDDLSQLKDLSQLSIRASNLSTIDELAFSMLKNVRRLSIGAGRNMTDLPHQMLTEATLLEDFSFNGSAITEVPPNFFSGQTGLVNVELDDNKIVKLPDGLVVGNHSLKYLSITTNPISSVSDAVFPKGDQSTLNAMISVWSTNLGVSVLDMLRTRFKMVNAH